MTHLTSASAATGVRSPASATFCGRSGRARLSTRGPAAGAGGERREIFMEPAAAEERHAAHWAAELGEPVPGSVRPTARTRLLSWLARRYSADTVLPLVERGEHSDAGLYEGDPHAAPGMAADERSHARVPTRMRAEGETGGRSGTRNESWHRSDRSGALRAAVFGVNDGLVSNTSLVMGFTGSGAAGRTVLFAGLAGLLAGASSMAVGEYISMRDRREAYEREIALESAIVTAAVALFFVGAALGLINGRGVLRSGARQVLIGRGAALVVYLAGRLVGT
jgi:vacuolar iron transporter family protein